ncbi:MULTISPECIES: HU family DNA-binding protein [Bacteroides]|jgi:predicted histone-like DNA-binding protein|uniref:HU family DNA-binding protein n=1 Tax=Bacteroides TaxID=816 RepID=UPI000E44454F|nr:MULTISPECIES: HU family DNA-binding protein [Bacteroides]MBS7575525.1 HU family DNA-binding protein [Bacteroides propionicigenes]RGM27410.1 DNA-binding protein [Bacteroides sp. OM08-17BH]RHJ52277.1 DNA-binding protein [Bacteroides sp. AM10-21B]HBO07548.1 DNA-binding protein [Bacteroides sp.]
MSIPYLVRQKKNLLNKKKSGLWYAVTHKLQKRGGVNEKELGHLVAMRGGFSRGVVEGVLTAISEVIETELSKGESVTIREFGSFHLALGSEGYEHPADVTPGKVQVSKLYFVPDRNLMQRLKKTKAFRIPLSSYLPAELLTPEILEEERKMEEQGLL